MLYLSGIIVSVYLLILFIAKPRKTVPDRILTIWQFVATIHLGFLYLVATGKYHQAPQFLFWEIPLPLIHGPLLYLYTLYVTHQQQHKYRWMVHFVPALMVFIWWMPLILMPGNEKLACYSSYDKITSTKILYYLIIVIISGIGYVTASIVLLLRHKKYIASQFSYNEKINLNWLLYLIGGISVIWLLVIFYRSEQSLFISVSLFVFFIGFFGIRQQGIFNNSKTDVANKTTPAINAGNNPELINIGINDAIRKVKYEKSSLTDIDANIIYNNLHQLMSEEQLFKDAELTLADVAKKLEVQPGILSQVINTKAQKSFYDYINSLRVDEFKQLASNPKNEKYTLLSIAFECGFNSKSSFNRNFKKFTGAAPSDYLKG